MLPTSLSVALEHFRSAAGADTTEAVRCLVSISRHEDVEGLSTAVFIQFVGSISELLQLLARRRAGGASPGTALQCASRLGRSRGRSCSLALHGTDSDCGCKEIDARIFSEAAAALAAACGPEGCSANALREAFAASLQASAAATSRIKACRQIHPPLSRQQLIGHGVSFGRHCQALQYEKYAGPPLGARTVSLCSAGQPQTTTRIADACATIPESFAHVSLPLGRSLRLLQSASSVSQLVSTCCRSSAPGAALLHARNSIVLNIPATDYSALAATEMARVCSIWLREALLHAGSNGARWEGGRPGTSWLRAVSRSALIINDAFELLSRVDVLPALVHQDLAAAVTESLGVVCCQLRDAIVNHATALYGFPPSVGFQWIHAARSSTVPTMEPLGDASAWKLTHRRLSGAASADPSDSWGGAPVQSTNSGRIWCCCWLRRSIPIGSSAIAGVFSSVRVVPGPPPPTAESLGSPRPPQPSVSKADMAIVSAAIKRSMYVSGIPHISSFSADVQPRVHHSAAVESGISELKRGRLFRAAGDGGVVPALSTFSFLAAERASRDLYFPPSPFLRKLLSDTLLPLALAMHGLSPQTSRAILTSAISCTVATLLGCMRGAPLQLVAISHIVGSSGGARIGTASSPIASSPSSSSQLSSSSSSSSSSSQLLHCSSSSSTPLQQQMQRLCRSAVDASGLLCLARDLQYLRTWCACGFPALQAAPPDRGVLPVSTAAAFLGVRAEIVAIDEVAADAEVAEPVAAIYSEASAQLQPVRTTPPLTVPVPVRAAAVRPRGIVTSAGLPPHGRLHHHATTAAAVAPADTRPLGTPLRPPPREGISMTPAPARTSRLLETGGYASPDAAKPPLLFSEVSVTPVMPLTAAECISLLGIHASAARSRGACSEIPPARASGEAAGEARGDGGLSTMHVLRGAADLLVPCSPSECGAAVASAPVFAAAQALLDLLSIHGFAATLAVADGSNSELDPDRLGRALGLMQLEAPLPSADSLIQRRFNMLFAARAVVAPTLHVRSSSVEPPSPALTPPDTVVVVRSSPSDASAAPMPTTARRKQQAPYAYAVSPLLPGGLNLSPPEGSSRHPETVADAPQQLLASPPASGADFVTAEPPTPQRGPATSTSTPAGPLLLGGADTPPESTAAGTADGRVAATPIAWGAAADGGTAAASRPPPGPGSSFGPGAALWPIPGPGLARPMDLITPRHATQAPDAVRLEMVSKPALTAFGGSPPSRGQERDASLNQRFWLSLQLPVDVGSLEGWADVLQPPQQQWAKTSHAGRLRSDVAQPLAAAAARPESAAQEGWIDVLACRFWAMD